MPGIRTLRSPRHFRRYRPNSGFGEWWLRTRRLRSRRQIIRLRQNRTGVLSHPLLSHLGLLLILLTTWAGLLLFLPFFRVKRITTTGAQAIPSAEEIYSAITQGQPGKRLIPPNNYFLLRERTLTAWLENQFPLFSITAKRIFPRTLQVAFSPRLLGAFYDNGQTYFFLDETGKVRQKLFDHQPIILTTTTASSSPKTNYSPSQADIASSTTERQIAYLPDTKQLNGQYGNYPIILDERAPTTTATGEMIFSSKFIAGLSRLHRALNAGGGEGIYYTVNDSRAGVTLYSKRRYRIRLQPQTEIETQLANLQLLLQQQTPKEYVDVRFADRLFWQ